MARISIIIPVYNSIEFLLKAVESAEQQTITEKEIIIVDDGSDDKTKEYLNTLKRRFGDIVLISTDNKGAGNARNVGIKRASGKYISFLDADDCYLDEDALEIMCNSAEKSGKKLCCALRKMLINGELQDQSIYTDDDYEFLKDERILSFDDFQDDFCFQNYIFERAMLVENNIEFPDFRRYQDPPFLLDALLCSRETAYVPCFLYCYRYGHQDKAKNATKILDTLKGIEYTTIKARDNGLRKLLAKNADRLNNLYYADLLANLSPELLMKLLNLNKVLEPVTGTQLAVINEICDMGRENLRKKYNDLSDAFVIEEGLQDIKINGNWREFLGEKIKTVSIYGLGKYGKKLVDSLIDSGIEIVSYVDKNQEYFGNTKVLKPIDSVPACDLIIISMANYRDIKDIPSYEGYNVQPLTELMWKYKRGEKPF